MATIVKRQNEKGETIGWQAKIRRRGYPPQSSTKPTKREAEEWAREVEREMDRGSFVSRREAESTTLKEALERYEREVTPRKRGADQEKYRIRALLADSLAKRTLAGIRGAEVAKFRDNELARALAPSSVMKSLALLSHLFETARKEWGIEVENPVKKISKPKVDNARERRLSGEEERYLLAALDDPGPAVMVKEGDRRNEWTPKIVRFAIETAMRQGEILALDWRYVDLDRRVAHLPETKNGSARDVPLSTAAIAVIKNLGKAERLRKGKVFPTTASALKQSFARAVSRGRRLYVKECEQVLTSNRRVPKLDPSQGMGNASSRPLGTSCRRVPINLTQIFVERGSFSLPGPAAMPPATPSFHPINPRRLSRRQGACRETPCSMFESVLVLEI